MGRLGDEAMNDNENGNGNEEVKVIVKVKVNVNVDEAMGRDFEISRFRYFNF